MTHAFGFTASVRHPRVLGLREEWFYIWLGLFLAPLFELFPFVQLVGWFFQALVHEMSHTAASWLVGVPAVPALGITAEAATLHGDQVLPLALFVWSGLMYLAQQKLAPPLRYVVFALMATLFPALCFSGLRDGWQLISGHLGELAIAALFLARALSGGFSRSAVERTLYSALGWFLIGHNLWLTARLVGSSSQRAQYASSGSYGIENDYLRLAEWSGTSLETCALLMSVLTLCVAPAVLGLWIFHVRDARA